MDICKRVDYSDGLDDWHRLRFQSVKVSVDNKLLDKDNIEGSTEISLNQLSSEKLCSEAKAEHLIDALKSDNIPDAFKVIEQFYKIIMCTNVFDSLNNNSQCEY